ncbi:MAG: HDOD domain-containing protein [Planctomyces sp.]
MSPIAQKSASTPDGTRPKFGNLPALPEVTFRILELAKDPSSTPAELQKLICSDVALSTRILKVVNSAFYGLSRQIGTIDRAVVVIGRNAVRNIAVAASMVKMFSAGPRVDSGRFRARDLWMHSTATATAARIVAEEVRDSQANELFLAGLTHDIGIMAEMHWSREKLSWCVNQMDFDGEGNPLQDLRDIEDSVFGVNHETLGMEVCQFWNFPEMISAVVGHHHNPCELFGVEQQQACIVQLADLITASLEDGFRLDLPSIEIGESILDQLSLSLSQLEVIRERLRVQMDEVAQMLS